MKFEHTETFNFNNALRGMRNPMNSWPNSDSGYKDVQQDRITTHKFHIGKNDIKLAQSLIKSGTDHSKFMRQIMVSVDITAPLYWWKEFDTYKVGTTANSTSTMHKLASTPITPGCFTFDSIDPGTAEVLCGVLELYRTHYIKTKDKRAWRALVQLLPSSWLQTRTVTMSYQNIRAMYFARQNHKLTEWSQEFIKWIKTLPYANELIMVN